MTFIRCMNAVIFHMGGYSGVMNDTRVTYVLIHVPPAYILDKIKVESR